MIAPASMRSPLPAAIVMIVAGLAGSSASGQADRPSPGDIPSPSELIEVPVTGLLPGVTEIRPDMKSPVADDPNAAARGMNYFTAFNCVGCHADNGGGGMGPALSNRNFIYGSQPAQIYLSIAQGRPGGMPAWGSRVPPQAIWDLVAYIESISSEPHTGWGRTTSPEAFDIEQAPTEFESSADPWKNTRPFSFGQNPDGNSNAPSN